MKEDSKDDTTFVWAGAAALDLAVLLIIFQSPRSGWQHERAPFFLVAALVASAAGYVHDRINPEWFEVREPRRPMWMNVLYMLLSFVAIYGTGIGVAIALGGYNAYLGWSFIGGAFAAAGLAFGIKIGFDDWLKKNPAERKKQ